MTSIWSNTGTSASVSPFTTTGNAPAAGGSNATKYQKYLSDSQSSKKTSSAIPGAAQASGSSKPSASAAAGAAAASSSTSTSSATISANDFLSLLVTEMQNQDPTSQQDPNEYINQLVQINSLEQLISINQNLTTVLGTATTPPATPTTAPTANSTGAVKAAKSVASVQPAAKTLVGTSVSKASPSIPSRPGNLTVPRGTAAAQTVSHSLGGHSNPIRQGHKIRDFPSH